MRRLYLAVVAAVILAIPLASMAQDRKTESKDKRSRGDQDSRKAPKRKGGDKAKVKEKGGSDKASAAREKIIESVKAGKLSREEAGKDQST